MPQYVRGGVLKNNLNLPKLGSTLAIFMWPNRILSIYFDDRSAANRSDMETLTTDHLRAKLDPKIKIKPMLHIRWI